MIQTLAVSASTIESYVNAAESGSSHPHQCLWRIEGTPEDPMDMEGSELWPTAALTSDHSQQHFDKHLRPMDMEGSELWPTAALTNDHSKQHYNKHLHPKDMEGSELWPTAAWINDHA
jgi:hypothetical protein